MIRKIIICFLLLTIGFGFAFVVRVPVTRVLKQSRIDLLQFKHSMLDLPISNNRWTDQELRSTVALKNHDNVRARRAILNAYVFGEQSGGVTASVELESNVVDARYSTLAGLQRIDKLTITMEFGLQSHVYLFVPSSPNKQITLYHQGHGGDFYKGRHVIARLVESGVTVAALSMPLLGVNQGREIIHPKLGALQVSTHEHLSLFKPTSGSALKFFIEPVMKTVDTLYEQGFSDFSMIGISGGAWTTALYAALDPRIRLSMPVAGSLPMRYKFLDPKSLGDFESRDPGLAALLSYPEIYLLGSVGESRRQVQVSNFYDPCCYSGDAPLEYKDALGAHLNLLGPGDFDVYIDYSHTQHQISNEVVDLFLRLLQNPTH